MFKRTFIALGISFLLTSQIFAQFGEHFIKSLGFSCSLSAFFNHDYKSDQYVLEAVDLTSESGNNFDKSTSIKTSSLFRIFMELDKKNGIIIFDKFKQTVIFELYIHNKGFDSKNVMHFNDRDYIENYNFNFKYLSIPVLLKFAYLKNSLSPYLLVGPRFDFLMKYDHNPVFYFDKKNLKNVVLGLCTGIGINTFKTCFFKTALELRYNLDFYSAYTWFGYFNNNLNSKVSNFEISLLVKF